MMMRYLLAALFLIALGGCTGAAYYLQSIDGQLQLIQARRSIAEVVENPDTPSPLKARLERVLEIRDFASQELSLPQNLSYRGYSDVRRQFVVWNVFAAPEFSIKPIQWCFPIAGCVNYRGYFAQADAETFAAGQRRLGRDVFVGGIAAYSTLGWFDDPVLNTFINRPEHEVARLIFHELAHQVAYVKNDTQFNESFAVAVENEGMRRWITTRGDPKMRADFEVAQRRRTQFIELVLKSRGDLEGLYATGLGPEEMRKRKADVMAGMKQEYDRLKDEWGGFAGYDRFFNNVNNATLASIAIYHALVPQFAQMIARNNGDLAAFYAEVKALAKMDKAQRSASLGAVTAAR